MRLSLIVAVARNGVIGRQGQLPWRLSADLKRFKSLTMGHRLVMGRKTYESIGKPLPGRVSIVLSRSTKPAPEPRENPRYVRSLAEALEVARGDEEVFVIGGADVFLQALPRADRLYVTWVEADVPGDTVLPPIDLSNWRLVEETALPADEKNEFATRFCVYDRV
jgi:dihydrofolate reductase